MSEQAKAAPPAAKPATPQKEKKEKKADAKDSKKEAPAKKEAAPLPTYIAHRVKVLDEYLKTNPPIPLKEQIEAKKISIKLPDGKIVEGIAGKTTPYEVAVGIRKSLGEIAVVAKVNSDLWDLTRPLEGDCSLEIFTFDHPEGKQVFWHSSAHVLGEALERLYGVHLCTGPPTDNGFFYDSWHENKVFGQDDYSSINEAVQAITKEKQNYERIRVPKTVAVEMFKYNQFKSQILRDKVPEGSYCTVYRCGTLMDPCRGPHLPSTARVTAFAVTKNSSAYWQSKAENPQLQRVYGISFPDKKLLKEWEEFQKAAAERDHRVIGQKQQLFFFDALSPGSCFWLPHGTRVYNKLMEFVRGEYRQRGFTEVITPNVYNSKLWEISGHWAHYKDNMFTFKSEDADFALKPMNCPGHCLMFAHVNRSWRELPIRFADFGVLHRNEASGALSGLTRVRRFQQDDAHIFCRENQIKQEMQGALDFLASVYGIFDFKFRLELSTRPEKYLGELETWNRAEKSIAEVLDGFKARTGQEWKINPGDGAFYGPKIDVHISDAIGRSFQCATIQLDFQLPIRFNLEFASETEGKSDRPVIIHRAIFGSLERFIAILTEHTGGKWPFWISPRQCIVLTVSEQYTDYAEIVRQQIHNAGYFVEVNDSDQKLQKKIREAELAQYNYILVVGGQERDSRTVNVRTRDNVVHGVKSMPDLLEEFRMLSQHHK